MFFFRKSVFIAFIFVFLTNINLYAFQSFVYTSDSDKSISVSFELPPETIEKLAHENDTYAWQELLGLSCKKNVGGEGCTAETSAIFEIPSNASNPVIRDAVGSLADGTVIDCPNNVYQGTTGKWRSKNIATPHVRPILYEDGKPKAFFVRIDFRIVWENGDIAKGKQIENTEEDSQYFEDNYSKSIVNYGNFPSYSKAAKNIKDVEGMGSIFGQKMYIKDKGIYRVTYESLTFQTGFKVDELNPRTIRMYLRGREIPIYVHGEENGKFEPGEYIEFYGIGDSKSSYTHYNAYWVTYGGDNGRRMAVIDGTSSGNTVLTSMFDEHGTEIGKYEMPVENPASYKTSVHYEANNVMWSSMPYGGEGKDQWVDKLYGFRFSSSSTQIYPSVVRTLKTPFVDADNDGYATVSVRIHGIKDTPGVNPDHYDNLLINDEVIGNASTNGIVSYLIEGDISNSKLKEDNAVRALTILKEGLTDKKYLDWMEIEYYRKFYTNNNFIDFPGIQMRPVDYSVGGFSKNIIKIYDVSDPYEVKIINAPTSQVTAEGSTYRVVFRRIEGREQSNYILLTDDKIKSSLGIIENTESDLRNPSNGADYLVITKQEFIKSLTEPVLDGLPSLVALRESQGYRVQVVDIQDVYDEFSYGVPDPIAIKRFLQYAYDNWTTPALSFVMLVGDATIDYFNDYDVPSGVSKVSDDVPSMIVTTEVLKYVSSDNPYACVSGADAIPDLYLGRLSVRTEADATAVVSKIISYETQAASSWNKNVLLISSNEDRFKNLNDRILNRIPSGFNADKLYISNNNNMGTAINNKFKNGALVTNFAGHGGITTWGNSGNSFYNTEDANKLANIDKPTFLVALNCLNGYVGGFVLEAHSSKGAYWGVSEPCLGESFLRSSNKGAIAIFTATGAGFAEEQDIIDQKLMEEIFSRGNYLIGSAVTNAKILGVGELLQETIDTFMLFGDPATKLKVQVPNSPTGLSIDGTASDAPIIPRLSTGGYVDSFGNAHTASRWQVTKVKGNYASPIYDSGKSTTALTSITIPAGLLERKVTYYWRAIHYSEFGASPPSEEQSFVVTGDVDRDGAEAEAVGGSDCNDRNPNINPSANELLDGLDNDCDGFIDEGFIDKDGDGYPPYSAGGKDCNDNDKNINPAMREIVGDKIDNNCDGFMDNVETGEPNVDHDGDGFAALAAGGKDCNDNNKNINPDAAELHDAIDNNCDGSIDEGFENVPADFDGDGYFFPGDDCDDSMFSVNPGVDEVLGNGIDDNCDGFIDILSSTDSAPTVTEWGMIVLSGFLVIAFWKRCGGALPDYDCR